MSGHIRFDRESVPVATSDEGWYATASAVGQETNRAAARTDITAVVGRDAGHGAPACFVPSLAEVHINTDVIDLGNPDKVDLTDELWRLAHAPAVGAIRHEAAHARHTRFDPRLLESDFGATRKMIDVITTLEEPRIEKRSLDNAPRNKVYLAATALDIVGRDFKIADSRYGASMAAGLLLSRVSAGVLTEKQAAPFREAVLEVLDSATLAALQALWERFLRLFDTDYAGMVEIAAEWLTVLGEDPENTDDLAGESLFGMPAPGEGGGGEGEDSGEGSLSAAVKGEARILSSEVDAGIVDKRGAERNKRARAERAADAERGKEAKSAAHEAFPSSAGAHGYSPTSLAHHRSSRDPNSDERRAARTLASALEKIDYRDRAVSKVTSMVPPGRLRGRAAVQESAARSMGRESTAPLWSGKHRQRVDSTPLTVGLMVDVSGSMSTAMEPLASTQWVLSTAGAHIDAKVASVLFGERVYGVSKAGSRDREVHVFYPGDGTEAFRSGALALDHELNLLDAPGARVLLVASDGVFVDGRDKAYASTFIRLAMKKGVAVLFLDFTRAMHYGTYGASVVDCYRKSPVEVASIVGAKVAQQLRTIDQRV
jgi:hypothetical protein